MSVQEIRFEPRIMCEQLDNKRNSFRSSQLEDGEIICFQKARPLGSEEECQYPDVPSFLEYVNNRQIVHFRSLEKPKEDDFCLELLKLHSYDEVTERVARRTCSDDPSKIRLTSHNCYSQQPKPHPIKYRGVEHLSDMLIHYNQMSDILYYEVLDIPLPELQGLKNLKIAFHHATKDEVVIHNIILPKQSTVGDMINELKTKVELSHPNAELRLLEIFYHKIYKIFPPSEKIENINDQYWTLRVEEIPEEEKNLGPHDRLIHVFHFTKESPQNEQKQVQNFGEPFLLVIHEGETLAEVKVRMQKKLQVPDEEFSKWKFAFFSLGHLEYLQDSDIVFTRFQGEDVYSTWEQYLGLEHSDNVPKRAYAVSKRTHIPTIARTISLPQIEDIGTISLDDVDVFFQSLSSETPASSAPSRVSKPSKEEIEEALKQIKEALQLPPVQFDNPGRISTIEKALQTLTALDESSGITIDQNAYLLCLTEKFKTLPARASKAIKSKDNLAQKETLRTRLNQNLKSYIANFTVKKAETFQAEQEIQELRSKQKAAKKKKENLATEIKELYKRSLLDKKELDALTMEIPKYEEEAKAGEEEEKALNEEWNNMMDLISNISTNLKFD